MAVLISYEKIYLVFLLFIELQIFSIKESKIENTICNIKPNHINLYVLFAIWFATLKLKNERIKEIKYPVWVGI